MGRKRSRNHRLPPRMHLKGSVYYHVTSTGGGRKWTRLSSSYAQALAKWSEIEGSISSGERVSEAIDRYLIEVLPRKAKKTQAEYGRQASMLREAFSEFRLDEVRPKHVAEYLDQRDAKVAANREVALLSTIYRHAMRWGWTDTNPCDGVARNPEKPRDRYITDTELQRLREVASDQFRCMILESAVDPARVLTPASHPHL